MMNSLIEDKHRKIIIEFCHLLEKAKQLFNGLRELPQYGHKQWHSYFGRTFDVYTKLWKFQQLHRAILDTKYGLKRWQIGEIASKIGQLYYHFYLRTSETAYLNEAYSFYSAIRGRSYYTQASKEDRSELLVKKLRYYARFIVVCLLLKKNQLVRDLVHELDHQVKEYGKTYDPDDQVEWILVLDEIVAFLEADHVITVKRPDGVNVIISNRLNPLNTYPLDKTSQMTLSLQEIVVVGSYDQVKFSELTMDMFRMLQTLEKEPDAQVQDESSRQRFIPAPNISNQGYDLESLHHTNTHKYLLFKPSPTQILVYLSSGCHDLPPNGALLLYISAEGNKVPGKLEASGYEAGGLITTSRSDINRDTSRVQEPQPGPSSAPVAPTSATQSKYKEARCLYPGDLVPYTRRPMFIIIESDNSYVFQQIPRHFGQPLIIMMSPIELPERLENKQHDGNLFTLFLHSPLAAVCYLSDIVNFTLAHWERAMKIIDNFMTEACIIMMRTRIDPAFNAFIGDDFFRVLLLRFIFCEVTIRRHRGFRARNQHPRILPALPEEIYDNAALNYFVLELADHLQIGTFFDEPIVHPAIKP
ncbi:protein SCAI [Plodia interpunctella]|uniref:protein SCAI n=1 Tax=Plodia interpunctella TaxID=58824 RepID=UPI0023686512|nr:protein SCAI [Plodia interpunctella]XP_053624874.1 protein SCAI [Plodia interpunctella]